ncbi:acidic amino acid decarboxylase GADL1 [Octopus bimaculoides]|uniref:Glutamate decarboxylase n=1 Tax=Octopus bimaculoides TaxID=37653 RepID=A0A0L8HVP6_OCTBM|nr:acidic amino acid decarboxylase GADL1 [Octopus bimaculoides]
MNGYTNGHTREYNFFEKNDVKEFLDSIHQLILDKALNDGTKNDHRVVEFLHPKEMLNKLQLDIGEKGTNNEVLLQFCEKLINMSVKTGKPGFYNQLYGFVDPYGLAGSWITDSLNTALHTYEVSPAFTMIEHYLIQKVCKMIGFQNGDGMFCPGGAFMNIMSIHLARYRNNNNIKKQGMYNQERMVVFASEGCHYSSVLAVGFLGIGQENLIKVKTDSKGKMSVKHLQNAVELSLKQGLNPIAVVATAGTTVLGAFDPLSEIADVCAQHNMWLHVDAAWGGFVLMSKKHRYRMAGVERVDSLAWNFHKMGNAPMQCSLLVVKEKGILEKCNSTNVEYLFQSDKYYDKTFDQGNKTIQCGKKVDNFKLWLMWKARGDAGMAAKMDRVMELSQYLVDQLRAQDDFRLVLPEVSTTYHLQTVYPSCKKMKLVAIIIILIIIIIIIIIIMFFFSSFFKFFPISRSVFRTPRAEKRCMHSQFTHANS